MFTYPRISAGIYEIQKDSNTVGFIRKSNPQKWIVVDVLDTPQHVTKTLKEAKSAVENLIIFNTESQEVDSGIETVYNNSVEVDRVNSSLNKAFNGSLNTYRQIPGTNEFEEVDTSELGFNKEPTLEPIEF